MRRKIARKPKRCPSGKVIYRHEDDARLAITRAHQGGPSRAYLCPLCHGWHTTSKPLK